MNAVNLIPLERRRADTPSLPGAPFLGLVGVLVVALAATFLYVSADNRVSTRQAELSRIHAGTNAWSAAAAKYAPAVAGLKHDASRFTQLDGLLSQRANWSLLLGQLAGAMPAHAQLDSLSASGPTATSGTTATAATSSASGAAGQATSGINITGCAASQPVVADTMVALRRVSGVSSVNLLSSVASQSGGSSSGSGGGACSGDDFTLSLQFTPVVGLAQVLGAKTATSPTSSTPSTSQTTSTSTPTGAAQ